MRGLQPNKTTMHRCWNRRNIYASCHFVIWIPHSPYSPFLAPNCFRSFPILWRTHRHFSHLFVLQYLCWEICYPGNGILALHIMRAYTKIVLNWIMVIASLRWSMFSHSFYSLHKRYEDTYCYTSHMWNACSLCERLHCIHVVELKPYCEGCETYWEMSSKLLATAKTHSKKPRDREKTKLMNTESSECIFL